MIIIADRTFSYRSYTSILFTLKIYRQDESTLCYTFFRKKKNQFLVPKRYMSC